MERITVFWRLPLWEPELIADGRQAHEAAFEELLQNATRKYSGFNCIFRKGSQVT